MLGIILLFILVFSAGVAYELTHPPTPISSPNPSPSFAKTEYGVCLHLYQFDNFTTTQLNQLNSKWIRIDWIPNQMDDIVNVMKANGIKILAILDHNTMNNTVPPSLDFNLPQWTKTVQNIMKTDAAKKVDAWEIWNEPNAIQFQFGYMNGSPSNYFDMLKAADQIIKASSPTAIVLAAGLSLNYPNSVNPNWKTWLLNFNTTSPQSFFDFQGVHLYDDNNTNNDIINQIGSIMQKDVWITEIGQPSAPSPYSIQDQSSYLVSNFQMLRSLKNPIFWYQLKDETYDLNNKEANFGLFDFQNNPKNSSIAFIRFASLS